MYVALPTADIVRCYEEFDNLFVFYDEGIKGFIRDAILEGNEIAYDTESVRNAKIVQKVIQKYSNSTEAVLCFYNENTSAALLFVELIAENIVMSINEMLFSLLRCAQYRVNRMEWKWVGDDLIVNLTSHQPTPTVRRNVWLYGSCSSSVQRS